ncbi:carboxypeptidase regulatory-like domain-containing protein [Planctomicrobium piriforme]|uniref:Carboxypeptidase regulatory-like domain-containing protein n=1 Tax=Planctomicrobium piriforme TaxID=1576369 RepID=A0A1I3J4Q3_9PLAN|nr:carboxypeptidase regulatory-like domain-containing protein [Planctomicrobium piriforme]SFI54958.1 hypothetical protein SAMN05421753_11051 [Planctomicrobium piriforme]
MHTNAFQFGCTLLLCLFVSQGCQRADGLVRVTGVVTRNGEPAAQMLLIFTPLESGSPSYGATDEQGRYELMFTSSKRGAQVGEYRVEIRPAELISDEMANRKVVRTAAINRGKPKVQPAVQQSYPAVVKTGKNRIDFSLGGLTPIPPQALAPTGGVKR